MIKLGITGGIGSGKSTVSKLLSLVGIPVYVADEESKRLTATSPVIKEKLIKVFGESLYNGDELNKVLLASYIFNDKENLQITNDIIHPEVMKDFDEWAKNYASSPIIGLESAIIFDAGLNTYVDKIVTIYSPVDVRIERVMQRDRVSKDKVLERINSQMPDEEKIKASDFVINNDGYESLISQTLEVLKKLDYKV